MKPAVFHPEAVAELQRQAVHYEAQSPGLGERFIAQVQTAIRLAESMPKIGSPYLHGTRRVYPKNFPHAIVYREVEDALVIVAIAPSRREPAYWRRRT